MTAVCSARNAHLARAFGRRRVHALRRLVQPSGTLVLSGGGVSGKGRLVGPLGLLIRAQLMARLPGPRIVILETDHAGAKVLVIMPSASS